jgi:hypothetical protein
MYLHYLADPDFVAGPDLQFGKVHINLPDL